MSLVDKLTLGLTIFWTIMLALAIYARQSEGPEPPHVPPRYWMDD
jgi:hypothetical protein